MATYVKLKGLARDSAIGDAGVMRGRGVRLRSPFKSAQGGTGIVAASYTPTANVVTYTARYGGAWGNNVSVIHAVGGVATPVVTVTYPTAGSPNPTITVTGTAATTPASVVTAVNAHPVAGSFVVASVAGTGAGTFAAVATTALSGGSDGSNSTLYPIHVRVTQAAGAVAVVDSDDPSVARKLRRDGNNLISLGAQ
jgi:hypothetical protein